MEEITAQRRVVLGLQHTVAMFGATVLVPLILGLSPSLALLSAGIGTLIFHLVTKGIVPVFLGSSFAFIAPIGLAMSEGYSLVSIGVGIIGAGVVYLIVSFLVTVIPDGTHKIRALFPPVVTGPIIAVIGITLAPVAISEAQGNWWLALVTLGSVIVAAIWFRGIFKMLPILTGFIAGYVIAIIFGQVDFAALNDAKWLAWPDFGGLFGGGEFDFGAVWLIAPVAFVTMIEHVGDILTNGRVVGKDFFDDPGINRTLLGDGLATIFAGLIGGPPNTTYSENTGVLAVTKVYDPRVLRIGAGFAILLGLIPKFGGLLQTVPVAVLGGISIVLFGMIASIGLRVLTDARVDFTQSRNLIVAALILVFGLGVSGLESPIQIGDVSVSGLALAAVVGVVANLVLPKAIDEPAYEEATKTV
ncbi:MAG TPA: uracil-xanthine permease family protein [Acidimicrobiia bacterium]|nr:uracil-xanthine permease family protein [Acidimicrobiia bacterium]